MLLIVPQHQTDITDEQWDNYVLNSDNGTLFNQKKFLNYHRNGKFHNIPLLFMKRDKIIAINNFALVERNNQNILSSYPGASWGGFVSKKPLTYQQTLEILNLTIDYAIHNKVSAIEITLPPRIYQNTPNDTLTFCLLKHGFTYKNRELTSIVDLRKGKYHINRSVRKAVNKSHEAGIITKRDSSNWQLFFDCLSNNLAEKKSNTTHTFNELLYLKRQFTDKIELWSAYKDNIFVGGLCNWELKKGHWLIFYSCCKKEFTSYRILNRLFYESIDYYYNNDSMYVDFGTSSINMKVSEGLINFKELYSAYGIFRDTLYLKL